MTGLISFWIFLVTGAIIAYVGTTIALFARNDSIVQEQLVVRQKIEEISNLSMTTSSQLNVLSDGFTHLLMQINLTESFTANRSLIGTGTFRWRFYNDGFLENTRTGSIFRVYRIKLDTVLQFDALELEAPSSPVTFGDTSFSSEVYFELDQFIPLSLLPSFSNPIPLNGDNRKAVSLPCFSNNFCFISSSVSLINRNTIFDQGQRLRGFFVSAPQVSGQTFTLNRPWIFTTPVG